jgi:hypothetical protein
VAVTAIGCRSEPAQWWPAASPPATVRRA